MASQDIVQVTNTTNNTTENTSATQRHLQELNSSIEIAVAQLKEDSSKVSKANGNISVTLGSTTEASMTSRTTRKRKTEPYISAVTIRDNEKKDSEPSSSNNQKRHKLAADIITFTSDSSELSPFQSDDQEDKVAKNEDTTTRRQKHAENKPKAVPIERPRRSIRPVVPYGSETAEQKVRNKKPIEILQGSGLPLSQIPYVLRAIDKMKTSDDVLKGLHKLIYGRMGSKHDIKNHIRAFSGFKIQTPLDEIVLKEKLEKWKIAGLKDMCNLFGLKSSGDKQKVVDRVYDFLKNPRDMMAPNEENGKGKGKSSKKKRSAAVKVKTIIIRRKTARDMFNVEQRPVYKEKAENQSKTRAEIDSLIAEAWRNLTEDDKKSYAKKAEEANRNKPQQKDRYYPMQIIPSFFIHLFKFTLFLHIQNYNKTKAKQPEMVEDSDLSEEEFEDLITHEGEIDEQKEQLKDADVVNLYSDFSDQQSNDEDAVTEDDNVMEVDLDKAVAKPVHSLCK